MDRKTKRGPRRAKAGSTAARRRRGAARHPGKRLARRQAAAARGGRGRWLRETWGKAVERSKERRPEFGTTSGIRLQPV
ncbi:MAG TPA: hypothetical protein VIV59_06150, partial [Anaeromyxobacteraceae bacterium]